MSSLQVPAVVRSIDAVVAAHASTGAHRVSGAVHAIEAVVRSAAPALEARRSSLREALRVAVEMAERRGRPPPVFTIIRRQDDELPLNRLLAWLLDPQERHGLGRRPLLALARALQFDALADDLVAGDPVEVRGEARWPADAGSADEPDLLVLTTRCALLVENKVWSSESGGSQYADYRDALALLASASDREYTRALLVARNRRAVPEGWTGFRTHRELAATFVALASEVDREAPGHWGSIALRLVAHALCGEPDLRWALQEAREVLLRLERPTPSDLTRAERLLVDLSAAEEL